MRGILCGECGDGIAVHEAITGRYDGDASSWTGARFITALHDPSFQFHITSKRREPPL